MKLTHTSNKQARNELYAGRVLNRFSKDIGQMDDALPPTFFDTIGVTNTTIIIANYS
jgi:hypothetical protein